MNLKLFQSFAKAKKPYNLISIAIKSILKESSSMEKVKLNKNSLESLIFFPTKLYIKYMNEHTKSANLIRINI